MWGSGGRRTGLLVVLPGRAGRGAATEIAMARGVSRATVDYQLVFARQLVTIIRWITRLVAGGAGGDERSIDALMCDLLVERVAGQSTAAGLHLEVGVVIAASSLLGVDARPAKLVGHRGGDHGVLAGRPRPAACRRRERVWARRLVCDPVDGTLLSMDTRKRRFDGMLRKLIVYRDGGSRRPYSNTPIYEIDTRPLHRRRPDHRRQRSGPRQVRPRPPRPARLGRRRRRRRR